MQYIVYSIHIISINYAAPFLFIIVSPNILWISLDWENIFNHLMIKVLIEDTQNMLIIPVPLCRQIFTSHSSINHIDVAFYLCWVKLVRGLMPRTVSWVADEKHVDIWILPFKESNHTRRLWLVINVKICYHTELIKTCVVFGMGTIFKRVEFLYP